MTSYWRIIPDVKNYASAVGYRIPYSASDFLHLDGESARIEESILVFEFDIDSGLPLPNFFPSAYHPVMLLDEYAFRLCEEFFSRNSYIYNGRIEDKNLYIVAINIERSGFDYVESQYERYDLPPPRNRVRRIKRLNLVDGFKTDVDLFRLNDEREMRYELVCHDRFKKFYEENKLKGLRFVETARYR